MNYTKRKRLLLASGIIAVISGLISLLVSNVIPTIIGDFVFFLITAFVVHDLVIADDGCFGEVGETE